jgi:hypothetical protein
VLAAIRMVLVARIQFGHLLLRLRTFRPNSGEAKSCNRDLDNLASGHRDVIEHNVSCASVHAQTFTPVRKFPPTLKEFILARFQFY